jgi:lycopene beta-cyclase
MVYDFIIVGAGAAGLSLAHHLLNSPLRDCSILILDAEARALSNRSWCFWARRPGPFDAIACRTWDRLRFVGDDGERLLALRDYRYRLVRGGDLQECVQRELAGHPQATFKRGRVEQVLDGEPLATVMTADAQAFSGRWVFDSRPDWTAWRPDPRRYHDLRQHFQGWVIEAARDAFDPEAVTFMDFRTPQRGELRFFYVLPLSPRRALVEHVTLSHDGCGAALDAYLREVLGISAYQVVGAEGGVSPLTDQPFPRRAGRRVMNIGVRGGRIKPTSGYAFTRIQQDSAAIVRSLARRGHPFDVQASPPLYRLCDSLLLHVLQRRGAQSQEIFNRLFRNNPVERVLRFLDEAASPWDNAALIASLPSGPFLQALVDLKVLGRV